jgi:hypothetical protein
MSHRVVPSRSVKHSRLIGLVLVLGAVFSGWGLYELGRYRGGYDLLETRAQQQAFTEQLAAVEREATKVREQKAILERSAQIEREAYKQLEATVSGLQDEILELKEELAFYRGIISPSDASKGLEIQSFELNRRGKGNPIHYKLVLTQVLNNNSIASGSISVSIEGELKGERQEYQLAQLSEEEGELRFRFKYFQILEGELHLPEGFAPSKVTITVKPRTKSHKRLSQSYDWAVQES